MAATETIGAGLTFEKVWAALMENREQIKAVSEQIGKLGNRFGETIEYMVEPNLVVKFKELGFTFERSQQNTVIRDQEGRIIAEIDVFLENGDRAMVVETKVKPSAADINEHIERMEKMRRYADSRNDKRKYLGAVAGAVFGNNEKTYALKKGFYVIEPSGDTFNIIVPGGDCHPREW
jgi:hypothetical protein